MTTLFIAAVFLGIFALRIVLWIIAVKAGVRWAQLESTWGRITRLAIVVFSVQAVSILVRLLCLELSFAIQATVLLVAGLVELVFPFYVLRRSFQTKISKTLQLWLPTLASSGIVLICLVLTKRYVLEAFVVPSNSMAPTIIGGPLLGVCPDCGATNYHRTVPPNAVRPPEGFVAICENFHSTTSNLASHNEMVKAANDRFCVNKLLRPDRWDIIAFRIPSQPSQNMLARLVGLPGETIRIGRKFLGQRTRCLANRPGALNVRR